MKNLFYLLLCLHLISCDYFKGMEPLRPYKNSLSKKYAELRKKNIFDVHYNLKFDLTDPNFFRGEAQVTFTLRSPFFLTLDFSSGVIESLLVNSYVVKNINYKGQYIEIPATQLVQGVNSIVVNYKSNYASNDYGLVRFKDPGDGRLYLYSHLTHYNANRLFPCFDQPNLKASFETEVITPDEWQVISTAKESLKHIDGKSMRWVFPITKKMSPYQFPLHAGEYSVIEKNKDPMKKEIPLRLFVRQSLVQNVDADFWLDLIDRGIPYYEKYFYTQYPYSKFDLILGPGLNIPSIGNTSVAVFNEEAYLSTSKSNPAESLSLITGLYQELASVWFGSLVTMNWLDDYWLFRSLAIHSSYEATEKVVGLEDTWPSFNSLIKQQVYPMDQSTNTHPVVMNIEDSSEILPKFDLISYGKGASLIKQLSFYLGEKKYGEGIKRFIHQYKDSNGSVADFIQTMMKSSGLDLSLWRERWLQTEMLNNVEVFFLCEKGRLSHFEIYQTGTQSHPTLRSHKTKVALLAKDNKGFRVARTFDLNYKGERTSISQLVGKPCPDIVYPNFQDYDYVRVILDKKSLMNIKSELSTVQDDFLRSLLWGDIWQMVLNQQLDMDSFLEIVEYHGLRENKPEILTTILSNVQAVLGSYYPREDLVWEARRQVWLKFFEQSYLNMYMENKDNYELQKIWLHSLSEVAESEEVRSTLLSLLKNNRSDILLGLQTDPIEQVKQSNKDSLNLEMLKKLSLEKSSLQGESAKNLSISCDLKSIARIRKIFREKQNIPEDVRKDLNRTLWENQRCLHMRQRMKTAREQNFKTI